MADLRGQFTDKIRLYGIGLAPYKVNPMTTKRSFNLFVPVETTELAIGDKRRVAFGGTAFTGNIIPGHTWDGAALAVDMATFKLSEVPKKTMILSEHNRDQKIGVAMAAKVNDQIILDQGKFFSTKSGLEHETIMAEGGPYEFSIGFSGDAVYYKPGERPKRQLNGKMHEIGVEMFNSRLHEVSLVTTGADAKTKVKQFSSEFLSIPDATTGPDQQEKDDSNMDLKEIEAKLAASLLALTAAEKRAELAEQATVTMLSEQRVAQVEAKFGAALDPVAFVGLSAEAFAALLLFDASKLPTAAKPLAAPLAAALKKAAEGELSGKVGTGSVLLDMARARAAKSA